LDEVIADESRANCSRRSVRHYANHFLKLHEKLIGLLPGFHPLVITQQKGAIGYLIKIAARIAFDRQQAATHEIHATSRKHVLVLQDATGVFSRKTSYSLEKLSASGVFRWLNASKEEAQQAEVHHADGQVKDESMSPSVSSDADETTRRSASRKRVSAQQLEDLQVEHQQLRSDVAGLQQKLRRVESERDTLQAKWAQQRRLLEAITAAAEEMNTE
jgi:hypothetical protein